jgi:hypothetical protein
MSATLMFPLVDQGSGSLQFEGGLDTEGSENLDGSGDPASATGAAFGLQDAALGDEKSAGSIPFDGLGAVNGAESEGSCEGEGSGARHLGLAMGGGAHDAQVLVGAEHAFEGGAFALEMGGEGLGDGGGEAEDGADEDGFAAEVASLPIEKAVAKFEFFAAVDGPVSLGEGDLGSGEEDGGIGVDEEVRPIVDLGSADGEGGAIIDENVAEIQELAGEAAAAAGAGLEEEASAGGVIHAGGGDIELDVEGVIDAFQFDGAFVAEAGRGGAEVVALEPDEFAWGNIGDGTGGEGEESGKTERDPRAGKAVHGCRHLHPSGRHGRRVRLGSSAHPWRLAVALVSGKGTGVTPRGTCARRPIRRGPGHTVTYR